MIEICENIGFDAFNAEFQNMNDDYTLLENTLNTGIAAFAASIIPSYAMFEQLKIAELSLMHNNISQSEMMNIIATKHAGRITASTVKSSLTISVITVCCIAGYHTVK